jgi:hypothetical protein
MTNQAYQIWETFKANLKDEPTEDMKKALGNAIRVISSNIHRSGILEDEPWLTHIADELNCISYDVEAL